MSTKSLLSELKKSSKKLLAIFSLSFFLLVNVSSAQTYVSGGIYTNTTWTLAGSPYIVTDTVVVFSNITLTIQPGVVVKFADDSGIIEVEGNFYANGTPTDSIIFTSNSATPYAGIYQGIDCSGDSLSFRYCRFSYASSAINNSGGAPYTPISHCFFISCLSGITNWSWTSDIDTCTFKYDTAGMSGPSSDTIIGCNFIQNGVGISGPQGEAILNCTFIRNNDYGISGVGGFLSIMYCTFDSNSVAIYDSHDNITYCSIKYNGVGIECEANAITLNDISDNQIGIETYGGGTISCNSICSNTNYNIVDEYSFTESISNNYWCLTDSAHIQATIYDAYQNFHLGFLYFTPFDSAPCTHICNLSISASATKLFVCHDSTTLIAHITDINPVYTAVWNPGNHHGLSYTVSPASDITYTLVVTDSSGCKDSAYITIDTSCSHICSLSLYAYATSPTVCIGDSSTLVPIVSDSTTYTAVWNPGNYHGLYYTVTPRTNTTYTVVVTDLYGCKDSTFVTVDTTYCPPPPCGSNPPPSICYVTTDTSGTFNTIVWQKTGIDTLAIDSVIIYRLDILGNYVPIGKVSVHAFSTYNDYTARPLVEPSFYTLGVTDTCGTDTIKSNFNETVFLQSSPGFGPHEANLNWNFYEGNSVRYYRILRDDSGRGNWHAIDSVYGAINAYTDRSAPVNPGLRYMISTDWNVVCTPSYVIRPHTMGRYTFQAGEAYSNLTYLYPTGIVNILDNASVTIFPNPVSNNVSISFNQSFSGSVTITNVLGQEVYSNANFTAEKGNTEQIDMSNLTGGVYIITLQSGDSAIRKKILKVQ